MSEANKYQETVLLAVPELTDGECVVAGRERRHLLEGAAARDARHGPEPHRGRAQQHGDGGGPGRERDHRVPGVPRDDEAEGKGR